MKKIIILDTLSKDVFLFRKHLIQFLVAQQYIVYIMATDFTPATKEKVIQLGATPIDYTFDRGGLNPLADLKNMKLLQKTFAKIQPDVLLARASKPVIFGTLAAKKANVPKIIATLIQCYS